MILASPSLLLQVVFLNFCLDFSADEKLITLQGCPFHCWSVVTISRLFFPFEQNEMIQSITMNLGLQISLPTGGYLHPESNGGSFFFFVLLATQQTTTKGVLA